MYLKGIRLVTSLPFISVLPICQLTPLFFLMIIVGDGENMTGRTNTVILIKALEDGVGVLFTTGEDSPTPVPERLDRGEVLIIAAPEKGEGIRVRGTAEVYTPEHRVDSESSLVIGGRTEESARG